MVVVPAIMTYRYLVAEAGPSAQLTPSSLCTMSEPPPHSEITLIGHRGCLAQAPENTHQAIEAAAPHVDMIELDVQRCGSGELVVFHDDDLARLTDATGPVRETDWATLRTLSVGDSDQSIPRLAAALAAVPPGTAVNLELKHGGMAEQVLSVTAGAENRVVYSAFDVATLRALRAASGSAELALLVDTGDDLSVATATALDCVAIHPHYELVSTTPVLADAHDAGLAVNVWTVTDPTVAKRLVAAGVDGLFVNRWDLLA